MKGCFQQLRSLLFLPVLLLVGIFAPSVRLFADEPQLSIPAGYRVQTVRVAPLKFKIAVGDRVNIVGFEKNDDNKRRHDVLESATVFAFTEAVDLASGKKDPRVSLLVSKKDADLLNMATEHCALQLRPAKHEQLATSTKAGTATDVASGFPEGSKSKLPTVERPNHIRTESLGAAGLNRIPTVTQADGRPVTDGLELDVAQSVVLTADENVVSVQLSGPVVNAEALGPKTIRLSGARVGETLVKLTGEGWQRTFRARVVSGASLAKAPSPPAATKDRSTSESRQTLRLETGESRVLRFSANAQAFHVSNRDVIDCEAASQAALQIVAKEPGRAAVTLTLPDERVVIDVHVSASTAELDAAIKQVFPKLNIKLIGLRSSVVLLGEVDDSTQGMDVEKIAQDYFASTINRMTLSERALQPAPRRGRDLSSSPNDPQGRPRQAANIAKTAAKDTATIGKQDDLRNLAEEVKGLRADVKQLIRLLKAKSNQALGKPGSVGRNQPRATPDPNAVTVGDVASPRGERPPVSHGRRFSVQAPTPDVRDHVKSLAERQLNEVSHRWFGESPKAWRQPCAITVKLGERYAAGGRTSYSFEGDEVLGMQMVVQARDLDELRSVLAHEVAHLVLAQVAGKPLPRWLDEGLCTTRETGAEQTKMHALLLQYRGAGRLYPVRELFAMRDYPSDVMPVFAQGHSIVEHLIAATGEQRVAEFVRVGARAEDWSEAFVQHFGFDSVEAFEQEWLGSLTAK